MNFKMIIDFKYVFLRGTRLSLEFFCFTSCLFAIIGEEKLDLPASYLLLVTISFYYIDMISQAVLLFKYLKNYNRVFPSSFQFEIWRSETCFHYLRKITILAYSLWNIGYIIFFLVVRPQFNSVISKALVYFILGTTLFRGVGLFFFLFLYSIFRIRHRQVSNQNVLMTVTIERNVSASEDECPICLEKGEEEWAALQCNHKFHYECINKWTVNHNSCPMCRLSS